jgi:hypothetical protein
MNLLKIVDSFPIIIKLALLVIIIFLHFLKTAGWFIPADSYLLSGYIGETFAYVIFSIALLGSLIQRTVPKPRPFWPKLAAIDLALLVGFIIRIIWPDIPN